MTKSAPPDDSLDVDDLVRRVAAAPPMDPPRSLEPGTIIQEAFEIVERLGAGGMGVVYLARDRRLNREVALKLHRAADERAFDRLLREARAVARLSHPNVVAVHDVGTFDGQMFMAMEYLAGGSLRRWLKQKTRTADEILATFVQAGRGLEAAHRAGLVHRDFKPDNVLVGADRVCVSDFGLARAPGDGAEPGGEVASDNAASMTGGQHGTPAYMAPEQVAGGAADARSDQFSFCVSLVEALAAGAPVRDATAPAADPIDQLDRLAGQLPRRVIEALRRGLSPVPADRFPSMAELLDGLAPAPARRPVSWIALGGIATLVVGVALWGWLGGAGAAEPTCDPGAPTLGGAWTASRRAALAAGFRATSLPYAERAAASAAALIDRHAADLEAARANACRDARVRGVLSEGMYERRLMCLRGIERDARALLAAWNEPDSDVVESAVQAAAWLPPVSECAVDDLPAAGAAVAADEPLEAELARVRALLDSGKLEAARKAGDLLLEQVRAPGRDALLAETLFLIGRVEEQLDHFSEAATSLEKAFFQARRSGDDRLAAEIAAHLARLTGVSLARAGEGVLWASWAQAEVDRGVGAEELELAVVHALGELADFAGRYDEAIERFGRGVSLATSLYGEDHAQVAMALRRLGSALQGKGELDRAAEVYGDVLERLERLLGPRHPDVAKLLRSLGLVSAYRGEKDVAKAQLERAVALSEEVIGAEAVETAYAHLNLGVAHHFGTDYRDAIARYERARSILVARLGATHPDVGLAVNSLAVAHEGLGEYDRALEYLDQALVIARGQNENRPQVATVLGNIGAVHLERRDHARAIESLRESVAVWRAADPDNSRQMVSLGLLGEVLVEAGEPREAIGHLERALELASTSGAPPVRLARTEIALARALWAVGRERPRALQLARLAVGRYRELSDIEPVRAAAAEAWLRARER